MHEYLCQSISGHSHRLLISHDSWLLQLPNWLEYSRLIFILCLSPGYGQVGGRKQEFLSRNQQVQQKEVQPKYFSGQCEEPNGRYAVSGQCDAYVECRNGVSEEKLCADGLLFNDKVGLFTFPCQYPIDVDCSTRTKTQSPKASEDCPHQFGYFQLGDRAHCGQFMNCAEGRGYKFDCPSGLAFNKDTYQCDYPDLVPDCDAEAFLGFTCPSEARVEGFGAAEQRFHKSNDCQRYFLCNEGRPRLYTCGAGTAFSEELNKCEDAENVANCGHLALPKEPESSTPKKARYDLRFGQ